MPRNVARAFRLAGGEARRHLEQGREGREGLDLPRGEDGLSALPPFRSVQYEAGVKIEVRGLTGTLAVFQTRQPNSFIDATNTFVVDGEQRNRGIELSSTAS